MTLQASGSISFSQISNEFGLPPGKNLGAYRVSQSVGSLTNVPLDTGIPQSGSISFSNFYSKKLNVVVDLYSVPDYSQRLIARSRYDNQNVTVIGGYKSRPSRSENARIIINVDKIIGSNSISINNVALRTGTWDSNTQLELEIGSNGQLYGAGGTGTRGANSQENPAPYGLDGTSALGIDYPTTIVNRGYIQAGGGGGGGGGWSNRSTRTGFITRRRRERRAAGNGGGGGAGFTFGSRGLGGNGGSIPGNPGQTGGLQVGGAGGTNGGVSGDGGAGGSYGNNGSNGANGLSGLGGKGGSAGRAIIIYNDGTGTSITNVGTINGTIIYNTTPT